MKIHDIDVMTSKGCCVLELMCWLIESVLTLHQNQVSLQTHVPWDMLYHTLAILEVNTNLGWLCKSRRSTAASASVIHRHSGHHALPASWPSAALRPDRPQQVEAGTWKPHWRWRDWHVYTICIYIYIQCVFYLNIISIHIYSRYNITLCIYYNIYLKIIIYILLYILLNKYVFFKYI